MAQQKIFLFHLFNLNNSIKIRTVTLGIISKSELKVYRSLPRHIYDSHLYVITKVTSVNTDVMTPKFTLVWLENRR